MRRPDIAWIDHESPLIGRDRFVQPIQIEVAVGEIVGGVCIFRDSQEPTKKGHGLEEATLFAINGRQIVESARGIRVVFQNPFVLDRGFIRTALLPQDPGEGNFKRKLSKREKKELKKKEKEAKLKVTSHFNYLIYSLLGHIL